MINIVHILPSLDLMGGTSVKIRQLLKYSSNNNKICAINNYQNRQMLDSWGNERVYLILNHKSIIVDAFRLLTFLKKEKMQILHVYYTYDTLLAFIVKIFCRNIKIVRSFEGALDLFGTKYCLMSRILPKYNGLIYISEYIKQYYIRKFPSLIPSNSKIIFNPPGFEINDNLQIQHYASDKIITCVSGLNKYKNLFILLDVMNILKKSEPTCKLFIIGDGPFKTKLQEKIHLLNLESSVFLLGYRSNVQEYLDKTSIYVHPADQEGFGMAVIEAMSRQCAVVVSNAGGLKEIVNDGIDGILAAPYDANDWVYKIKLLFDSQEKIDFLGTNAKKKVQTHFSTLIHCRHIDCFYQTILD